MSTSSYGITIEVPEELVEEILSRGRKPAQLISALVLRLTEDMNITEAIDYAEGSAPKAQKHVKGSERRPGGRLLTGRPWSYAVFEEYMKGLVSQAEIRASVGDLISMLIAYFNTSSRPTSEELRIARGFHSGEKWFEELRTSKARLSIAAKHQGLHSFFPRAYGSGLQRRHPIDEGVYGFLSKWVVRNKAAVETYSQLATPRSVD